ncbi:hypothetical protein Hanom_Chr17g01573131 [Helianthus anomalus]
MNSYREGLKGSVGISFLQARLKIVYEARALGFECPSWNVNEWEARLKDLGGNPVELPSKPVVEQLPKRLKRRLMLVVMLVRMLMKLWFKRVQPLEGSEVGNDGYLCPCRSPLFLNLMVVIA